MSDKKIFAKNPCEGVTFDTDVHKKFDVAVIPHCDLHKKHPLRVAWQKREDEKPEDQRRDFNDCKAEVATRCAQADLGRQTSLSYAKLVRNTASRYHKTELANLNDAGLKELLEKAGLELEVDDTARATLFILGDKTRLFQNLIAVVGLDTLNFAEATKSVDEIVAMFVSDVAAEIPHAKPKSTAKSRKEIEAELKAEAAEREAALKAEALAYVQRAGSEQGVQGVELAAGAFAFLKVAYEEVIAKCDAKKDKDVISRLEAWATPFKMMWGL